MGIAPLGKGEGGEGKGERPPVRPNKQKVSNVTLLSLGAWHGEKGGGREGEETTCTGYRSSIPSPRRRSITREKGILFNIIPSPRGKGGRGGEGGDWLHRCFCSGPHASGRFFVPDPSRTRGEKKGGGLQSQMNLNSVAGRKAFLRKMASPSDEIALKGKKKRERRDTVLTTALAWSRADKRGLCRLRGTSAEKRRKGREEEHPNSRALLPAGIGKDRKGSPQFIGAAWSWKKGGKRRGGGG